MSQVRSRRRGRHIARQIAPHIAVSVLALASSWALVTSHGLADEEEGPPSASDVLAKIDEALFFPDSQARLARYECKVSSTDTSTQVDGRWQPKRDSLEPLAHVVVDRKSNTKTWTDAEGKSIHPGTWAPACGPWTLTNVMQFEVELFMSPLSKRFTETAYDRSLTKEGDGWRVTLTPKKRLGTEEPFFLRPGITRIELVVGKDGVPIKGTLRLDMGPMKENGTFEVESAKEGKVHRIAAIRNVITAANMKIRPALSFVYAKQGGFLLLESVEFGVPHSDLSPALGRSVGGDAVSALVFDGYEVKAIEPEQPPKDGKPEEPAGKDPPREPGK